MATKKTSPAKSSPGNSADFETSLAQLEAIVSRMEKGDMSLEESLQAFEEGVKLTRLCQQTLTDARQKVQLLMSQQGKIALQEMEFDDDENHDDDSDR